MPDPEVLVSKDKYDRRASRNRTVILVMVVLMALSLVAVPLASLLDGSDDPQPTIDDMDDAGAADAQAVEPEPPTEPETTEGPCGPASDDVPEIASEIYDEPFDAAIDADTTYTVTLETTCGDIVMELDTANAPAATSNLVALAEDGYYDGVVFHRVVPGFVIQVGDPAGTGCGQQDCAAFDPEAPTFPGYSFADELGGAEALYEEAGGGYPRGTVAMANAGPDTNGSQFFVAQGDPTALPGPDYTVLGTVVEGMDVVDDIAASPADERSRPYEDVAIRSVTITES